MLSSADLEGLPEDAEAAFVELVDILNKRLAEASGDDGWHLVAQQYVQILLAYIDEHDLEVGMGFSIDRRQTYSNFGNWFDGFRNSINYYQSRYRFRKRGTVGPAIMVLLPSDSRDEIHVLLNKVRKIVATLDMSDGKRNAIYDKIAKLESEIDRSRTRIDALMALILEVSETAGKASEKLEPAIKLLERVRDIFVKVKDTGGPKQIGSSDGAEHIKRLEGPSLPKDNNRGSDLDDDIPF